jgi:hypothetical protein
MPPYGVDNDGEIDNVPHFVLLRLIWDYISLVLPLCRKETKREGLP